VSDCVRRRFKSRASETTLWRETKRNHPLLSRRRRRRKRGREGDRNTFSFFLSSPSILNNKRSKKKKREKNKGRERREERERADNESYSLSAPMAKKRNVPWRRSCS